MQSFTSVSSLAWSCVIRTRGRRFPHSPSSVLSLPEIPSGFLCATFYRHVTTLFCNITGSALLRGELFTGKRQPLHIGSGVKREKGKVNRKRKSWWWNTTWRIRWKNNAQGQFKCWFAHIVFKSALTGLGPAYQLTLITQPVEDGHNFQTEPHKSIEAPGVYIFMLYHIMAELFMQRAEHNQMCTQTRIAHINEIRNVKSKHRHYSKARTRTCRQIKWNIIAKKHEQRCFYVRHRVDGGLTEWVCFFFLSLSFFLSYKRESRKVPLNMHRYKRRSKKKRDYFHPLVSSEEQHLFTEIHRKKKKMEIRKGAGSFSTGAETWDVMETEGFAPGLRTWICFI